MIRRYVSLAIAAASLATAVYPCSYLFSDSTSTEPDPRSVVFVGTVIGHVGPFTQRDPLAGQLDEELRKLDPELAPPPPAGAMAVRVDLPIHGDIKEKQTILIVVIGVCSDRAHGQDSLEAQWPIDTRFTIVAYPATIIPGARADLYQVVSENGGISVSREPLSTWNTPRDYRAYWRQYEESQCDRSIDEPGFHDEFESALEQVRLLKAAPEDRLAMLRRLVHFPHSTRIAFPQLVARYVSDEATGRLLVCDRERLLASQPECDGSFATTP